MSGLHLKRLHFDSDSFIIWLGPDKKNERGFTQLYRPSLGIHIELPWSQCTREFGAPPRIYLHLWNWHVIIAMSKEGTSQSWSRKYGNTERWRWVTWHPDHDKLCCGAPVTGSKFGGRIKEWECGRLRGHRGEHR